VYCTFAHALARQLSNLGRGGGSFGMIFVVGLGVFVTLVSPYPILLATGDVVDLGI